MTWLIPCLLCFLAWSPIRAHAASVDSAQLQTADTQLSLEAGSSAPRLISLQAPGKQKWENRASEALIGFVKVRGKDKDTDTPLTWRLDRSDSHVDEHEVMFVYESASPHLRLTWEWQVRSARGPIEHETRIENLGDEEVWLPLQDSLAFDWKIDSKTSLRQLYVEKGANTPSAVGTHDVVVSDDYKWNGTSSTYADLDDRDPREIIPWFLMQRENGQNGWYVGIEFSGRTRLTVERKNDSLHGEVGLNPEPGPFLTRLEPGETFETPTIFLGGFRDGSDGAGNVLRRWVREVLNNPETWKNPSYPMAVNNSWGGGMDVNEDTARRMIRDSAELGLEMFHLDAGWFRGVGDWYADPKKFPHGIAAIADDAHAHGLKFGLWVDWAQAGLDTTPGALNVNDPKVKDWMVTDLPPDWKPEPFKGQTIDLGVPDARQWAQREVERIVTDYRLDMLEHDGYLVARGCDRTDHPHAAPDPLNECIYKSAGFYWVDSSNSTDVSYHAVRAYYDIYAALRKEHPELLLEICNDGGRMVDFGSAAHGDYFSITDTYDPLSNRRAFYDASHVLPAAMLESYVEKWPAPHIENFRYMLRSGMMGWLTVMLDTTTLTPEQHNAAKEEIKLYKDELRPLIRDGDLYHISTRPDGIGWDGMEYVDLPHEHGAVFAFRGSDKFAAEHTFVLRGLKTNASYRLRFQSHSSPDRVVKGRDLQEKGLHLRLSLPNSSEIILLEEVRVGASDEK